MSQPTLRRAFQGLTAAIVLMAAVVVGTSVDFSPQVESDFFFSSDDPQFQDSRTIGELFPSDPQILIAALGEDPLAEEYLERLRALGEALGAVDGVRSVMSLVQGPTTPGSVEKSPLWSRILLGENPNLSQLVVAVDPAGGPGLIREIEAVIAEHHRSSFALEISGVPYVVEQIRRHLARDLRLFSLASLVVFGLLIAGVYRSTRIVVGTLVTCLGACATALALLHVLGKPIGLLTANIVTIVFVLTLSHLVFLTANWRQERGQGAGSDAVDRAVSTTLGASFWCMLTTFLGFSSLLFATAQPLRELGFAGALGAAVAIVVAYGLYPVFLPRASDADSSDADSSDAGSSDAGSDGAGPGNDDSGGNRPFPWRPGWAVVAGLFLVAAVAAFGLRSLDTDPQLMAYFADSSPIRPGLERIDRNGGSSPLLFVVRAPDGTRLDSRQALPKLDAVQEAFDADPAVGSSLSLSALVAEARRVPLAGLLPVDRLVDILASPTFDGIANSFITEDRQRSLLFLRMRETDRQGARDETIERLTQSIRDAGLEVELTGGLFQLQSELGALVTRSLLSGLGGLLLLFVPIAAIASRMIRSTAAMVLSLAPVPVILLGAFGWLRVPVDIITSPAANVAIALGIDSMIHLVSAVRRRTAAGEPLGMAWHSARDRLWPAIAGATLILAAGFGIFGLSSFPPTQRFGIAVAFGTLVAAAMALLALPALGGASREPGTSNHGR